MSAASCVSWLAASTQSKYICCHVISCSEGSVPTRHGGHNHEQPRGDLYHGLQSRQSEHGDQDHEGRSECELLPRLGVEKGGEIRTLRSVAGFAEEPDD